MNFPGPEHIYWVAPPTNGNPSVALIQQIRSSLVELKAKRDEILLADADALTAATARIAEVENELQKIEKDQVLIGSNCVTVPDMDAEALAQSVIAATEPQSKWQELSKTRTYNLMASKFKGTKNLTIAGAPVRDFAHFYKDGPPEMVAWWCKAVMMSEVLAANERKN